jgi:hypothetical protein
VDDIDASAPADTHSLRKDVINALQFLSQHFAQDDITSLEMSIFTSAYETATKQCIIRSWKSVQYRQIYKQKLHTVLFNLHPQSPVNNARLITRILDGELKLVDIPSMSVYDMFPENWLALKNKLLQREQKILEGNKSRATDQFKCRRCQKKECTYYELQTRSADEPMTIFITCLNCGKEWRQGG